MMKELTEKQRTAMIAVAIRGMPLEEVARRMGTNRNSLYKLLHDARLKLKLHMENQGFSSGEIFSVFE
jgi:RNA polymerase sigma-70 factor (ECF subfamily)